MCQSAGTLLLHFRRRYAILFLINQILFLRRAHLCPKNKPPIQKKFTVYRTDGDHLGNVKLGALLRYAQQVATAHAEAVGLDDALYRETHTAYVLAKLALHVIRLPRVDEELTPCDPAGALQARLNKRITHFYDAAGQEVVVMDSRWCSLTPRSASSCASIRSSLPTNGPRMCPPSCP